MNKYEVLGVVGEGAYGVVMKCRDKTSGEIVAIKKFKDGEEDDMVRKTTEREIRILRAISHPNSVTLLDTFKKRGKHYLVFEFMERNLLEVLEEFPQGLPAETVRRYLYQLVRAISYCHSHNIVHRDIKPENLLVNSDMSLKICDFGFARHLPDHHSAEELTDYVATRWYRSPELLLGTKYGMEADVWAIGCIMGELTDGQPLFPGESEIDQLFVIQKVLGPLTKSQHEAFMQNKRFTGLKFPDMSKPEMLEKRYVNKMEKEALSFLKGVLRMNPDKRMNIHECLSHSYFDGMRSEEEEAAVPEHRSHRKRGRSGRKAEKSGVVRADRNADMPGAQFSTADDIVSARKTRQSHSRTSLSSRAYTKGKLDPAVARHRDHAPRSRKEGRSGDEGTSHAQRSRQSTDEPRPNHASVTSTDTGDEVEYEELLAIHPPVSHDTYHSAARYQSNHMLRQSHRLDAVGDYGVSSSAQGKIGEPGGGRRRVAGSSHTDSTGSRGRRGAHAHEYKAADKLPRIRTTNLYHDDTLRDKQALAEWKASITRDLYGQEVPVAAGTGGAAGKLRGARRRRAARGHTVAARAGASAFLPAPGHNHVRVR